MANMFCNSVFLHFECIKKGFDSCSVHSSPIGVGCLDTSCHRYGLLYFFGRNPDSTIQSNGNFQWKATAEKRKEKVFWI